MTEAQRRVYQTIAGGPRGGVRGPFNALLRSPELADRVQKVGEYLRFDSSLPPRLNELAILVNARFWGSKYEWYAHRPLAEKAGLAPAIADDLARNARPSQMQHEETVVYDFCTALHTTHAVRNHPYDGASKNTSMAAADMSVAGTISSLRPMRSTSMPDG